MSRSEYELAVYLFGICHGALQVICFRMTWNIFFSDKILRPWNYQNLRKEKGRILAVFILAGWNLFASGWPGIPSGIRYLVSALGILGYMLIKRKEDLEKTAFVLLLFYNFHGLGFLISNSMFQYADGRLMNGLNAESQNYLSQVYLRITINQWLLLVCYGLMFLLMIKVLKKIVEKPFHMNWQDVLFLSVLNAAGGMFARIVMELSFVKMEQEVFMLFDERREMIWKIPAIAVFIYVGEISAIYIYQRYMALLLERQKHFVEGQQTKALHRRLEEAENFYGSVRKVRHEMRNHMINIKGLAAGENYEELEHYIERLDETIQTLDYKFVTGNPVTDVVINDKYQRAAKAGIDFQVNFHYVQDNGIPVFDLGILLSNLLDNAIEACGKLEGERRYIVLTLKQKPPFWLLEVENNFLAAEGFPGEGIGLKNVREIAERYLGGMDIRIKQNIFQVIVMLQQREE